MDPDLLSRQFRLRNQLQHWRAQWAETLFAACASLVLLAVLVFALQAPLRSLVNLPFGLPVLLAALVLGIGALWFDVRQRSRTVLLRIDQGWLGATPWSTHGRRLALSRSVLGRLALQLSGIALLFWLLLWLRQRPMPEYSGLAVLFALVLVVAGAGLILLQVWRTRMAVTPRAGHAIHTLVDQPAPHLRGLDLLHAGWTPAPPRSWKLSMAVILIALPSGAGPPGILLMLLTVAAIAFLARGFARYRAIVVHAAAWLHASPLLPSTLLRSLAVRVLRQQVLVLGGLVLAFLAARMPVALVLGALAGWLALLLLMLLLSFALRFQQRRYPVAIAVRLIALVLLAQALPPLALLLWLGLVIQAGRAALSHSETI